MRILIAYPPLSSQKGSPMLTQNRQFQWFHEPSFLYPCVPAQAASLLQACGHEVQWCDAHAEGKDWPQFLRLLLRFKPEMVSIETKGPVVRQHWAIIGEIKTILPDCVCVLMGDHVSGNPKETMTESRTDFAFEGGDWDFMLQNLVEHLTHQTPLKSGVWYRNAAGEIESTGPYKAYGDLNELPFIDRHLTNAHLYFEKWKKRLPFVWTMAGRDCPYGRCTFCSWTVTYPNFRTQSPKRVVDEIEYLVNDYGAKEVFDDTGALPTGNWLNQFCNELIDRKLNDKIIFDCNFRFDYFTAENCQLMKKAGFRKLILGIESASERTIDILDKDLTREQIIAGCRMATEAGLQPHLTLMVGYPWETREDAYQTLALAKELMLNGYAHHLQATVIMPYPGTPLFELCQRNGWIRFGPEEYDRYDMTEPVCALTDMNEEEVVRMAGQFYKLYLHPKFLMHQMRNLRSLEDLDYMKRGAVAIWGHIKDFAQIRR
ncbi:MAG: radical SAM protein [Myxococcota bacterium]|nr:radical SAM protein [Myxococcota bacterium]